MAEVIKTKKRKGMSRFGNVAVVFFYAFCSISMTFLNKIVITSFQFNFPFTLMVLQMFFTGVSLEMLRITGTIDIVGYSFEKGVMFLWPSFFYTVNAVLSLIALSGMNIPIYGVVKRTAPLLTLLLSVVILKKEWPNRIVITSVFLLVTGCFLTAVGDLSLDLKAYGACLLSVIAQSSYQVLVEKCALENMHSSEILLFNSYNSLPVLCLFAAVSGEVSAVKRFGEWDSPRFLIFLLMVTCMGCLLNYSLFLCCSLNSALTTSIVGPIKSGFQTAIGLFTFGGVKLNFLTATGIFTSLFAGVLYTLGKYYTVRMTTTPQQQRRNSSLELSNGSIPKA